MKKPMKLMMLISLFLLVGCQKESHVQNTTTSSFSHPYIFNSEDFYDEPLEVTPLLSQTEPMMITEAGTYYLEGDYQNTLMIAANQEDTVRLILSSVHWSCQDQAAIIVQSAGKVQLSLPANTTSTMSGSAPYLITSNSPLVCNGTGTLILNASQGTAINSQASIVMISGQYQINAQQEAIHASSLFACYNATMTIYSDSQAIVVTDPDHAGMIYLQNGALTVQSQADSLSCDGDLVIHDGTYQIASSHQNGLLVNGDILIENGHYLFQTKKAALKAAQTCSIHGGDWLIQTVEDSLDIQDQLMIKNAQMAIYSDQASWMSQTEVCLQGGQVFVYAKQPSTSQLTITGGQIILGNQTDSPVYVSAESYQPSLEIHLAMPLTGTISLKNIQGEMILQEELTEPCQYLLLSCPALTVGETYQLSIDDWHLQMTIEP